MVWLQHEKRQPFRDKRRLGGAFDLDGHGVARQELGRRARRDAFEPEAPANARRPPATGERKRNLSKP